MPVSLLTHRRGRAPRPVPWIALWTMGAAAMTMEGLHRTPWGKHRMYVRNQWYVAAWDHEIDRAPMARTICGEPIVLYRKFDRSVVAMHDACPHRLLPLSMGIKEGDSIRCRYHGLLINSDGRAIEMPVPSERAHKTICAKTYPIVERYRFVWIWIGDSEKSNPDLIPDFWPCSHDD